MSRLTGRTVRNVFLLSVVAGAALPVFVPWSVVDAGLLSGVILAAFALVLLGTGLLDARPIKAGLRPFLSGRLAVPRGRPGRARRYAGAAIAGVLFGALWSVTFFAVGARDQIDPALIGDDLVVVGTVAGMPRHDGSGSRFDFEVMAATRLTHGQPADPAESAEPDRLDDMAVRVRLSWRMGDAQQPRPRAGERWRFEIRVLGTRGGVNPGRADGEARLLQAGIRARGYVRPGPHNRRLGNSWSAPHHQLREMLKDITDRLFRGSAVKAHLQALMIGDTSGLGDADWTVLNRTGTSHLLVISGLHVGLVAAFAMILCGWMPITLRMLTGCAVVVFYAAIAGLGVSVQRALVMVLVGLVVVAGARVASPAQGFVIALVVVVGVDPVAFLSAGFWLSFLAVAALLTAFAGRVGGGTGWRTYILVAVRAQLAIALVLTPCLVLMKSEASLVAWLR